MTYRLGRTAGPHRCPAGPGDPAGGRVTALGADSRRRGGCGPCCACWSSSRAGCSTTSTAASPCSLTARAVGLRRRLAGRSALRRGLPAGAVARGRPGRAVRRGGRCSRGARVRPGAGVGAGFDEIGLITLGERPTRIVVTSFGLFFAAFVPSYAGLVGRRWCRRHARGVVRSGRRSSWSSRAAGSQAGPTSRATARRTARPAAARRRDARTRRRGTARAPVTGWRVAGTRPARRCRTIRRSRRRGCRPRSRSAGVSVARVTHAVADVEAALGHQVEHAVGRARREPGSVPVDSPRPGRAAGR